MQTYRPWIFALLLVFMTGCTTSYSNRWDGGSVELSRTESEDQNKEIYELKQASDEDEITLVVRSEQVQERSDLGVILLEIGKAMAQEKLLTPFSGLYVKEVNRGGPAEAAGILPGDILTTVNGTEVLYLDLFDHILQVNPADTALALTLLRGFEQKGGISLNVTPAVKKVLIPTTKAIPLEPPQVKGPCYAGLMIGTLPTEWTEKVYGDNRSTVLISKVLVGSPAYCAGLRSGDRILSVNESYFETATELKEWIIEQGEEEETIRFEVFQNKGGNFRTEVDLERTDGEYEVAFPFLFDMDHNIRRTDWDLGLGLISNYDGQYLRTGSRKVNYRRELSFVLDLINYTWTPESSRLSLLWIFEIGSL